MLANLMIGFDNRWATIAGMLAMVCLTLSPLFKHRTSILAAQLATSAGYGVHYALCGLPTAAVSCGLSAIQSILAIPLASRPSLKPLFYLFVPVLLLGTVLTWQGPVSGVAAVALALTTLARMQKRPDQLRIIMLGAQSAWLVHDAAVWSLPAITGDIASLVTGIMMISMDLPSAAEHRKGGYDPRAIGARPAGLAKQHLMEQSRSSLVDGGKTWGDRR